MVSKSPAGSEISKTDPRLEADRSERRPLWASMIDRQIDRPMPVPSDFVVKNGWKMRSAFSGSIPGPESSTMINTPSGSRIADFTRSVRARSVTVSIASIAFATRLAITCCSWIRSANTDGSSEISSACDRNFVFLQLGMQQRNNFTDDFIDAQQRPFSAIVLEHRPNVVDHLARPVSFADDALRARCAPLQDQESVSRASASPHCRP